MMPGSSTTFRSDMMNLADNIRRIRLERGMTQSALAEAVGVSDRAVSRWERDISTPDVSLLTRLSLVLGISADALLGVVPQRVTAEILRATEECTALLHAGRAAEAVAMLREKSALYPNQPELMVYLARALLALKTEASTREALALCRAAQRSGRPMRLSTTYGCNQVMALSLHRLGKPEQAAQLVEDEMPAIFVSRELMLPLVAPPERAMRIRRSNVNLLAEYLVSTLQSLGREDPAFSSAADSIRQTIAALHAPDA